MNITQLQQKWEIVTDLLVKLHQGDATVFDTIKLLGPIMNDILHRQDDLLERCRTNLSWMYTQLEWNHREQKGDNVGEVDLSPEMKNAKQLLNDLKE